MVVSLCGSSPLPATDGGRLVGVLARHALAVPIMAAMALAPSLSAALLVALALATGLGMMMA